MKVVKLWESDNIILDSGYFFGRGVFETIRINDNPIFLGAHIERLNKGLRQLGLKCNVDENIIFNIIKYENLNNVALKVTVSEKNLVLSTRHIPYKESDYKKGFKIVLSNVKRNSTSRLNNIKSINYIENIMEKENAKSLGYDEPIFINEKNEICEGATTNIFLVKDNKIRTPYVKAGLLDGIIRKYLLKNFDVEECSLSIQDLRNSEEVILSNSLMNLMWVSQFENKTYEEGKVYKNLREKYDEHIRHKWREY